MRAIRALGALAIIGLLGACGKVVEVPPAHVGVVLTPSGYETEVHPPSSFRLAPCFIGACDRLVIVEASDQPFETDLQLFMPKDELNIAFDIRGTASISSDAKTILRILDRVVAQETDTGRVLRIDFDQVFNTYALPKIRTAARSKVSEYTIGQLVGQREAIGAELMLDLQAAVESTPISLTFADLAGVQYPEVIVKAKEVQKEREVAIKQEEAQKEVSLVKAQAELELAQKDRLVRLERARTIKEENDIVAESVTDKYLAYRQIEVMEKAAESPSATIFFPSDMLGSAGLERALATHADKR